MADIIPINDGKPTGSLGPDVHGQAALMLSESILHALVGTRLIRVEDALAIIQTAQDVKVEVGDEEGELPAAIRQSIELLDHIAISFQSDLN